MCFCDLILASNAALRALALLVDDLDQLLRLDVERQEVLEWWDDGATEVGNVEEPAIFFDLDRVRISLLGAFDL